MVKIALIELTFEIMIFFLICIIFLNIAPIRSFNIDLNHAIVFTDEFSDYFRSSYFGYSVILYSDSYNNKTWVQIGSPRGNASNFKIREPGVIYRCSIFGPCMAVSLETSTNLEGYEKKSTKELFGGAWLGGAMDINPKSGRVVICGHRWRAHQLKTVYFIEGVCYWSHVNDTINRKLIPLNSTRNNFYPEFGKSQVYYYADGQAGICAHFSNSREQQELLLGAPGVLNWAGTTIIYKDGFNNLPPASRLVQPRTPNRTHRRLQRSTAFSDFTLVNIANALRTTETMSFELFGYSATSGYFFNKNELLYASAAPRTDYKGQVLIYNFASATDEALQVRTLVKGQQFGEYFGGSLTAGDINQDGLDDLIVGAPHYAGTTYNQGRVYIFLGTLKGKFETPELNPIIVGESPGGQFGTSLMFLGNFTNDGYTSVAVGAPYENDNIGAVYIYRGSAIGLKTVPAQKILGSSFSVNIKGFGISFSKPTDVDKNFYNDVAIGAYLSKHAVILRSKSVITIQQSLARLTPNLDYTSEQFGIKSCVWYIGYKAPLTINITRKISVDEIFLRAYLNKNISLIENITLKLDVIYCQNITVFIKKEINNRNDPITVTVTPELILNPDAPKLIYATHHEDLTKLDTFCKDCPISNPYLSTKGQTIDFSFALGCGEDNVCTTKLSLRSKFIDIRKDTYLLGSTEDLIFELTIHNSQENAYQAQAIIELPNSVNFRKIPNFCSDRNLSTAVICNVGNPLMKNETRNVTLVLDMRKVDTIKYGNVLQFTITLTTTSNDPLKDKQFNKSLIISREADIAITGLSSQQSYLFDNSTNKTPNFTHIFQIQKYGPSPIEEVILTILVPSRILTTEWTRFVQFYQPVGMHGNQPINCKSDDNYLLDDLQENIGFEFDISDDTKNMSNYENKDDEIPVRKRSIGSAMQNTEKENNETMSDFGYARNRVFNINCSDDNIICSKITCNIGPFTVKQYEAKIQLKMRLDVMALFELLDKKNIIALSTEGRVVIKSPMNFEQTGSRDDEVRISSVFILENPETTIIESWIIIIAVIVGLLLLCLLILGLTKAGFFNRKIKQELKALKELDGAEQFHEEHLNDVEDNTDEAMDAEIENEKY